MDALTRVPLSQQAAQALLDDVARGRWEVGEQLPGEMALASELGIGRSTVREAIRQLAARGVLTTRQGVGVFLAALEPAQPWDRLAEIAAIADIVQVRVAIETRAAALAAERHVTQDADAVRTALDTRNAALGKPASELAARDVEFHRTLVAAAHNPLLTALFDGIVDRLIAAMTDLLTLIGTGPGDADDHAQIVEAILTRDAERAERLTRRHLLGLAEALRSSV